jgi:hypothetical protein
MTPSDVINNPLNEWRLWEWRFPHLARGEGVQRAKIDVRAPPLGSYVRVRLKRSDPGRRFLKETDPVQPSHSHSIYQVVGYNLM